MAEQFKVEVKPFSKSRAEILLYTLKYGRLSLSVSNIGATVTRLTLPDASGAIKDIVLGFDTAEPYLNGTSPYFGCIVGRVANRIAGASFEIDGERFHLSSNDPPKTLHGGAVGFDKVVWSATDKTGLDGPQVEFRMKSVDGDQGFPGELDVVVVYHVRSEDRIEIRMEAIPTSKATPVNLAHHMYWNLAGHDSGDVLQHRLQIPASFFTPVDDSLIPLGRIEPVDGTPFDFRNATPIGHRIEQVQGGYDHNFVLQKAPLERGGEEEGEKVGGVDVHLAARVEEPNSGRILEVFSDAPGVQFYSGNFLDGSISGKGGVVYAKHSGFCLETQGFPNAVNERSFPSILVRPGEVYRHNMLLRFK